MSKGSEQRLLEIVRGLHQPKTATADLTMIFAIWTSAHLTSSSSAAGEQPVLGRAKRQ
jgi:hypothetical protein